MGGFIKLSRYLANLYPGDPTIDTTGRRGVLSLCTLAKPYSLPGLLPDGIRVM